MKKGFVFILVGLVYVVIAMAASWANSSQTIDRTLDVIGITPGTDAGHSLNSIENPGYDNENAKADDNIKMESQQTDENEMLAYFIPVPPPGSGSGTRPQEIINS